MRKNGFYLLLFLVLAGIACKEVAVNEKIADIPKHRWPKNAAQAVTIAVTDTAAYNLVLLFRHTLQFRYNNILLGLEIKDSSGNQIAHFNINAGLTTLTGKWKGVNIDDLYDYRIDLHTAVPLKKNRYRFIFKQLMNADPLTHVLNVGIALEQKTGDQP